MDPDLKTEKLLANITTPKKASREDVRDWVVRTQRDITRRNGRKTLFIATVLLLATGGIWISLQYQANQVHQLIDTQPPKAIVSLREIMLELCGTDPPEYFVQQLEHVKSTQPLTVAPSPRL